MSSALPQFDLATMLRCPATDDEGFRCRKAPAHEGPHVWARCEYVDPDGHRCGQPPRHPGRHDPPWYDRPARPGEVHEARYEGTEKSSGRLADAGGRIFAHYSWRERSRRFKPGLIWRSPISGFLSSLLATGPHGVLKVTFEYRPTAETDPPESPRVERQGFPKA